MRKHHANGMGSALSTAKKKATHGWKARLKFLISQHNLYKIDGGGTVSHRTRHKREDDLFVMFGTLRELGYKLEDPRNLKPKHVQALVQHWIDSGKAVSTIDNHLSVLRIFTTWLGKGGLVTRLSDYVPGLTRQYAATHDKSWSANDVDFWTVWDRIFEIDRYVPLQLLLIAAFGVRAKESIMFEPLTHVIGDDKYISLFEGTKGGRPRLVPIDDDFKREIVILLQEFGRSRWASADGHLGNPDKTLKQNIVHYYAVLHRCGVSKSDLGVTGHGLRAEYACNELEKRGITPTVRGGTGKLGSQRDTDLAYLQVSENLGHSRKSVMPAYAGGFLNVLCAPVQRDLDRTMRMELSMENLAPRAARLRVMFSDAAAKAWKAS